MTFNDELNLFLKARYPIIYINTIEEDRVEYVIRKNIKTNLKRSIYSWDFIDGYTNNPNNEGFAKRNPVQALELVERLTAQTPALFLLKDFNRFLTDVSISRKLKNISRILKLQPKTIIIIGSELNIPKSYLGIEYSEGIIFIQATISFGRSIDIKKNLYRGICDALVQNLHVRPQDIFINLLEVSKENWSFGNGEMQYADKD